MLQTVIFVLLCFFSAQVLAKPVLRWCAWEFPGYVNFTNPQHKAQGISVDFMQQLAERAGFTLQISEATPVSRCLRDLADGNSDLVVNILKTAQAKPDIDYIAFGARRPDLLYLAADSNRRIEQVSDLATFSLAAIRHYGFHPRVQAIINGMSDEQLIRVSSVQSALEILARKRVDAALLPPSQVETVLQQYPQLRHQIKSFSFPLHVLEPQLVHIGLGSHCQCPKLAEAIRSSIQAMTDDGSLERIFGEKIITRW